MAQTRKYYLSILSLILALTFILSACGDGSKVNNKGADATASPAASPSASASPSAEATDTTPYTVQHAMGSTEIKGTPKRIVVLTNEGTEAVLSLGITPVGIVRAWGLDPIYQHLVDKLSGVELLGDENQPNLELIAALKPDLILGNKFRQEKIYEQLSDIAPTVFSERLNGDWQINYKIYAEALNKKEDGQAQIDQFTKRTEDFKTELGDDINKQVSIVRFNPGGIVRLYFNDTFSGVILKQIGLKRPAVQDKAAFSEDVGKERIPDMEGDVLFYFAYDNEKGEAAQAEKEWQEDALWKNLNVVKSGNVHKVYDGVWNSSGGILAANLMLDDLQKYLLKK
ncbi:iron-siderophore ABC transporter substrate-binding protein [Paenibacillus sp. GSMTC-2017]|uniref:ABC transporter substrate-binding protein n=1 Tax=Paenibacillus sp. GSMTC-2017 TaxID=2794350 RepID=UPI0018D6285B|nr:iron-siderophore ABC transporter substrate-binding protein [Paenibacillus sp. GSMTC-2017]MBH5320106.1 iron-siderophore ABC transporter substrate-binding protein [Paenibacillus sp. GSMTC-2017]